MSKWMNEWMNEWLTVTWICWKLFLLFPISSPAIKWEESGPETPVLLYQSFSIHWVYQAERKDHPMRQSHWVEGDYKERERERERKIMKFLSINSKFHFPRHTMVAMTTTHLTHNVTITQHIIKLPLPRQPLTTSAKQQCLMRVCTCTFYGTYHYHIWLMALFNVMSGSRSRVYQSVSKFGACHIHSYHA